VPLLRSALRRLHRTTVARDPGLDVGAVAEGVMSTAVAARSASALGGVSQRLSDVLTFQIWKVVEDLVGG
jgi:hypothetical protein